MTIHTPRDVLLGAFKWNGQPLRQSLHDQLYNNVRDGIFDVSKYPSLRHQLSGLLTDAKHGRPLKPDIDDDTRIIDLRRAIVTAMRFPSLRGLIMTLCAECLAEMGDEHTGRTNPAMLHELNKKDPNYKPYDLAPECEFAAIE
jgi:hypothetical protein